MAVAHTLRVVREILRNVFAREVLAEEAIPPPESRPPHPSLARMLFAPEPLPLDPERPAPRPSRGPPSAADTLGEEPSEAAAEAPGAPRQRWLRWLFRPEHLDPLP